MATRAVKLVNEMTNEEIVIELNKLADKMNSDKTSAKAFEKAMARSMELKEELSVREEDSKTEEIVEVVSEEIPAVETVEEIYEEVVYAEENVVEAEADESKSIVEAKRQPLLIEIVVIIWLCIMAIFNLIKERVDEYKEKKIVEAKRKEEEDKSLEITRFNNLAEYLSDLSKVTTFKFNRWFSKKGKYIVFGVLISVVAFMAFFIFPVIVFA